MNPTARQLMSGDLPAALELCRSASWNQTHADWSRLIRHDPNGCFAVDVDGALAGTVTTVSYGTDLAWIGMMLVHSRYRRRGIATDLIRTSLDYLHQRNVQCIKLDATPEGQSVYERLGFQVERTFQRWVYHKRVVRRDENRRTLTGNHFELDRMAFAVDRSRWLTELARDCTVCVRDRGFGMLRPGANACYLGPVVAETPGIARELIQQLMQNAQSDSVYWDVMNEDAAAIAKSLGFSPIRDLARMWIGEQRVFPAMNLQFAISDLATG